MILNNYAMVALQMRQTFQYPHLSNHYASIIHSCYLCTVSTPSVAYHLQHHHHRSHYKLHIRSGRAEILLAANGA